MEYKNYYEILGAKPTSTQDEIKRAYKKMARKFHPDLNKEPDAEDKFKEIGEAYEVLGDVEKRAAYDQLGQAYNPGEDFHPPPNWDAGFEYSGRSTSHNTQAREFSEFFESLFGHAYRQQQSAQTSAPFDARGQDHHAKVLIDLSDSLEGAKRTLALKVPELSQDGHVILNERKIEVSIPKGIMEGQHIRLKNQGAPGFGKGKPGHLYLEIIFNKHPTYNSDGADLYLDLPITPWEAALGGKVKIPTPQGLVDLTIPKGSKQGAKLRLKGRGLPAKPKGDLIVNLQIVLPPADTPKSRELYETMARDLEFNPRAELLAKAF